jgi:putative PIN family toxin of toxin-antitoxin system
VFDTNVFISALAIPGGQADKAMLRVIEGKDHLIISKDIIKELLNVLSRKFSRDQEELAHVGVYLAEIGELIEPGRKVKVLADQADNRILECARAGEADLIVTGDRAMLALGEYEGIKIASLREYVTGR